MKKTRMIPPLVMLMAGAITVILTTLKQYTLQETLWLLLLVMFVFAILGYIVKRILDKYTVIEEKKIPDEGEVIEKEVEEEDTGKEEQKKES